MEGQELTVYGDQPLTPKEVKAQVVLIQEVMKEVMQEGQHYGKIPGCGDKPALLKPGAEKLNLTFRFDPEVSKEVVKDFPGGHREYELTITLYAISSRKRLADGVGTATTMESKWRYRNAEPEITDKRIPNEYWNMKKKDPTKALETIGGKGFVAKKTDSGWFIAKLTGGKIEHDNPADYYNTCRKMAKKRALVDAVLTATGASDIFTQDIDELLDESVIDVTSSEKPETKPEPQPEGQPSTIETLQGAINFLEDMKKYKVKVGQTKFYEILTGRYTCTKPEDVKPEDQLLILKEMEEAYQARIAKEKK